VDGGGGFHLRSSRRGVTFAQEVAALTKSSIGWRTTPRRAASSGSSTELTPSGVVVCACRWQHRCGRDYRRRRRRHGRMSRAPPWRLHYAEPTTTAFATAEARTSANEGCHLHKPMNDRLLRCERDEVAGLRLEPTSGRSSIVGAIAARVITFVSYRSTPCRMQRGRLPYAA